ncbi:ABC transporter substrate-binding protein, partial [Salmonella enterica subsp. enterica serovar Larochelle]|nr:ABC transporter substrate-binding protein [Salmonella enterica subsp. enterica serovar Larochelle]
MSSNSLLFRHVRTLMFALTALPLVGHAAVETIAPGKLT